MADHRAAFAEAMLVRMFRLWVIAREDGQPSLPLLHQRAGQIGLPDETAVACESLFELVESHLGRELRRECCCSTNFSPDERALIGIVHIAPALEPWCGSREIPQGLSGAIVWAAMTVCRALGIQNAPSKRPNAAMCPVVNSGAGDVGLAL